MPARRNAHFFTIWSVPLKLDTYSHLAGTLKSYGKAHRQLNKGSVRG